MIRAVIEDALRKAYQSGNSGIQAPGLVSKAQNHSIETALDVQARTCRNQPAAPDRQFLPACPQAEFPVLTELFFPFEEQLMQVQGVLIPWPRRVQSSIDKAALDFRVKTKPPVEVKIGSQEITLKKVAVPGGRDVSSASDPKPLRPESDFPGQREKSIFCAERDVFERIPEVYLLAAIFEEAPIFLRQVRQIDPKSWRLTQTNRIK